MAPRLSRPQHHANPRSAYNPTFSETEYEDRIRRLVGVISEQGCAALILCSPQLLCYFTGFDGWGFYMPQFLVVTRSRRFLMVRQMDAAAGCRTTYMSTLDVLSYPDEYVDNQKMHPLQLVCAELRRDLSRGGNVPTMPTIKVGLDMDSVHCRARYLEVLQSEVLRHPEQGVCNSTVCVDVARAVNDCRSVKSAAELDYIRKAARIADRAMLAAVRRTRVGVAGSDVAAAIAEVQASMGTFVAIQPMVMANEYAAHMNWTSSHLEPGQTVAIELAGAHHHYHCPISRTVYLGSESDLPQKTRYRIEGVCVSLQKAVGAVRPGVRCSDVHSVFAESMAQYGMKKKSRIGYSFGLGFPPDWGENTFSIRPGDDSILKAGMCVHMIVGCGDALGFQLSEAIVVQQEGAELLCATPRVLFSNRNARAGRWITQPTISVRAILATLPAAVSTVSTLAAFAAMGMLVMLVLVGW